MAKCNADEKDITSNKLGAKVGISVISIVYFIFILFIAGVILSVLQPNNTISKTFKTLSNKDVVDMVKTHMISTKADTFIGRFTEWFTKVGNTINSGSVLVILTAGVVMGFNSLIMTPIISTIFPLDITANIQIPGRDAYINPGQFFIAFIGFVLSLIFFFFVAEIIYLIRWKFKNLLTITIILLLFIFLTFMLIWNSIETDKLLKLPDCVPLNTK